MADVTVQYLLVAFLVIGLTYLAYLLRDKGKGITQDYFGIANTILSMLTFEEGTPENVKKILRIVSDAVNYVEINLKNEDNTIKEEKALALAKESLSTLNFKSTINDESIKYIIRLASTFLPPTNKDKE